MNARTRDARCESDSNANKPLLFERERATDWTLRGFNREIGMVGSSVGVENRC